MGEKKKRLLRIIECFINDNNSDPISQIYGKGSRIKIKDIFFTNKGILMVDCSIMLGDVIVEESLDKELASILIQESLVYFFPDTRLGICINFDV